MTTTPVMEDYLEKIYLLIEKKGYARVVDIASSLNVLPSSATKMIQRFDELGFVIYEKYRGIILTSKGKEVAKDLINKHKILEDFLIMIGVDEESIYQEVEGIEHYINNQTASCISDLVDFFNEHPSVKESFVNYCRQKKKNG